MDRASALVVDVVIFSRSLVGLITRPYETYRQIVKRERAGELVGVVLLLTWYFALASLVKVASFRPFLLTRQFVLLGLGTASGALIASLCIYFAGRLMKSRATLVSVIIAWAYTLIPTVLWFFSTSVFYVLLPPPRTTSVLGVAFSLLFLVFSATLLWWKITLAYLTLRFSLRIDFMRSIVVALLCAPVLIVWAVAMYKTGIFKVPFL